MELNPSQNPIIVKCKGADTLPIDTILEFQGKLKRLSPKNRDKLMVSICTQGFIAPIFVWDNQGDYQILDGHQRLKTLLYMRQKGWDIPLLPVAYIDAENEQDARTKLLHITSQYGEFVQAELDRWLEENVEDIQESIRLSDKEMNLWKEEIKHETDAEYEFSQELMEAHNYVVLYFDNEVDWQTAMHKLGVKSVHANDSKEGYERKGIGRVLPGAKIIDRLDA